jgi:hypothetical protein
VEKRESNGGKEGGLVWKRGRIRMDEKEDSGGKEEGFWMEKC